MLRKRTSLVSIILSLIFAIGLIAQPMVAITEVLTQTVDNSVDKSSTQVVASLIFTSSCSDDDKELRVYDSDPVKVSYSNPRNEYIESLVDAAEAKLLRLADGFLEARPDAGIEEGEVFVDTHESSYDNRVYTWVQNDESEGGSIIGDSDSGVAGNQNRHMVVEGDYARTTIIVLELNIHYTNHLWDEGVVTKEATDTEDGLMTYTCNWCEGTKTEAIPRLSDGPVIIETPIYKGDIVADGMVHPITEFYDFSGLPEGTKIILNIDGETEYISVPDELQRLEVREPVEIPFELELPQGYIFENHVGPDHIMYCTMRVLGATNLVDKPIYKGDITEDGLTHYMSEFYDLDGLPEGTIAIVTNDSGDEISISLTDLKNISGTDPVDDSFTLSLPEGYAFTDDSTSCVCPFKILASENQDPINPTNPTDPVNPTDPQPKPYIFIEGQNGVWEQSSNGTLTFRANGDFDKFTGVKVDGSLIDEKYYTAASGSTIVTLKNDYLKTLAAGNHSLTVVYTDGECSTNFEIKSAQKPVITEQTSNQNTQLTSPQTGANSNMMLLVMILVAGGTALTVTTIYGRKRKHN